MTLRQKKIQQNQELFWAPNSINLCWSSLVLVRAVGKPLCETIDPNVW